jgi:hypothetical protein
MMDITPIADPSQDGWHITIPDNKDSRMVALPLPDMAWRTITEDIHACIRCLQHEVMEDMVIPWIDMHGDPLHARPKHAWFIVERTGHGNPRPDQVMPGSVH